MLEAADPAVIVFSVIALVIFAAVIYVPAGFMGNFKLLADRYETHRRPSSIAFPAQRIMVGRLWGGPRLFADNMGEFARFDIAVDDDGLWLLYDGPSPKKAADCMLVPWNKLSPRKESASRMFFDIDAGDAVEITVDRALGEAISRRIGNAAADTSF